MCYQVRFITRSVKCMVTMRWVLAWLGNEFRCSMKDERTCTMRREVGVHVWWMMIWCLRSTKECVTTDVSQFLICLCTFLRFQLLHSMTLSVVAYEILLDIFLQHNGTYFQIKPRTDCMYCLCNKFIHSLVFSLEGLAWQEPEPSHVTGMALVHCILGKFLGVVCHCFPPPLDVPERS